MDRFAELHLLQGVVAGLPLDVLNNLSGMQRSP